MVIRSWRTRSRRKSSSEVAASTIGSRNMPNGAVMDERMFCAVSLSELINSRSRVLHGSDKSVCGFCSRNLMVLANHADRLVPSDGVVNLNKLVMVVRWRMSLKSRWRSFSVSIKYKPSPTNNLRALSIKNMDEPSAPRVGVGNRMVAILDKSLKVNRASRRM